MKRLLLLVAALAIVALLIQPASAQTPNPNPISLGFRAGLNLGSASFNPDLAADESKSMRTGLAAGGYGEIGVAEGLFVTLEALYVQGGVKVTRSNVEFTDKLDVIDIPLSLKYKFAIEGSPVKPFIFAGGDLGIVAKAETETPDTTFDTKDSTESMSYGVHFGAGVQFEISPGVDVFVDGQYGLGLKNMNKSTIEPVEIKPTNIAILAGVIFRIN